MRLSEGWQKIAWREHLFVHVSGGAVDEGESSRITNLACDLLCWILFWGEQQAVVAFVTAACIFLRHQCGYKNCFARSNMIGNPAYRFWEL